MNIYNVFLFSSLSLSLFSLILLKNKKKFIFHHLHTQYDSDIETSMKLLKSLWGPCDLWCVKGWIDTLPWLNFWDTWLFYMKIFFLVKFDFPVKTSSVLEVDSSAKWKSFLSWNNRGSVHCCGLLSWFN